MDGAPVVIVLGAAAGATLLGGIGEIGCAGGASGRDGAGGGRGGSPATERVAALLDGIPDGCLVICDVTALVRPGPADLDQLGRLRMATRRRGCGLLLRNAGTRLRLLLELTGLDEVFVCEGALASTAGTAGLDLGGTADAADPGPGP